MARENEGGPCLILILLADRMRQGATEGNGEGEERERAKERARARERERCL